jgi:hypothetical protein
LPWAIESHAFSVKSYTVSSSALKLWGDFEFSISSVGVEPSEVVLVPELADLLVRIGS